MQIQKSQASVYFRAPADGQGSGEPQEQARKRAAQRDEANLAFRIPVDLQISFANSANASDQLDRERLSRVLGYIEAQLNESISVTNLANVACLSTFHFTRLFTGAMGVPPHYYVSRRRLENAKAMIAAGRAPLYDNCRKMTSLDRLIAASNLAPAAVHEEIAAAFHMWEAAINITFREASGRESASILIGAQAEPQGWAFADISYDSTSTVRVKPISLARICLNPAKRWKIGFDGDLTVMICVTPRLTKSATRSVSTIRSASVRSWDIATRSTFVRCSLATPEAPPCSTAPALRTRPRVLPERPGLGKSASHLVNSHIWGVRT